MSKQVAVIGLGRLGMNLAKILHDSGYEVLAIDKNADLVDSIMPQVTHAVRADATNEAALHQLGLGSFEVAVVTVGASIQDSVMITILLKNIGVRYIVARADNELHGEILRNIGAHKILFPEKDTALREGPILTMPDVIDFIPLGSGAGVIKLQTPSFFVGRTLSDIGFGQATRSGAVVLMIQRGKEGIVNPNIDEVVSYVDVLIIAGNVNDIEKVIEKAKKFGNGNTKSGDGSH
jgi:trk system potassium uptake protein TrkA